VELKQLEHPFVLEKDSYANLDMTMPVDEYESDELESYFQESLRDKFPNVVEYLDVDISEKINNIIKKIQDPEIDQLLLDIIENDLVGVLKDIYLEKK
jgi:hypothetical protein